MVLTVTLREKYVFFNRSAQLQHITTNCTMILDLDFKGQLVASVNKTTEEDNNIQQLLVEIVNTIDNYHLNIQHHDCF